MLNKLIPQVGFPWAVRIIGFLCIGTLAIPLLAMKVRVLPSEKRPLVDWTALRQPEYVLFVLGTLVGFLGLYSLFYYVQSYAISKHLMNQDLAFYLLSMLNAASAFGRLLPNILADKVGALNCLFPAALLSGIMILLLIPANSTAAVIVIVMLFGFFSGTFVSLPPTIVVHMTKNRGLIGTRLGMCFAVVSFGMLCGPPIDGAILGGSGFTSMWIFGGIVTIAGAGLLLASRVVFKGWKLNIKA
jgi:predicted MFS family arabinose efflux permease